MADEAVPLTPFLAYSDDFAGAASPTAVALADLAALMHRLQTADGEDIDAFVARHRMLPEFPVLAHAARCVWRGLHAMVRGGESILCDADADQPVDAVLSTPIFKLLALMDELGTKDDPQVYAFLTAHNAIPGFLDLAAECIREWQPLPT